MYNRRQSQRHNPPDIPIFVDSTVTPATSAPSDQWVLAPIANNQHVEAPGRYNHNAVLPFAVQHWYAENTLPTDERSARVYLDTNPGAYGRALSTRYPPQGQPIVVDLMAWGWEAAGQWHAAWFDEALNQRYNRPLPDVNPRWTRSVLEALDREYRGPNWHTYTGLAWPTPATGMTTYLPTLREVERTGIYIQSVDWNGSVMWVWQGTQ